MDLAVPVAIEGMVGKSKVRIGRFTYGRQNLVLRHYDQGASLNIGSFCSIADQVTIFLGGEHDYRNISTYPFGVPKFLAQLGGADIVYGSGTKGDVTIGHDVWLGDGASIMSGLTVGHGAVIAAKAHVVKSVAPYEIVGGNPAKHIKFRFNEPMRGLLLALSWWDLPVESIKEISSTLHTQPSIAVLTQLLKRYRGELTVQLVNSRTPAQVS